MRRTAVVRLLLLAASVTVSAMSAEGILRLMYPRMTGAYQDLYVLDPELGYMLKPTLNVEYRTGEYTTQIRANALGFRDDEHGEHPEPGISRIVVLGDSMTEALQVPFEVAFHQQLERQLSVQGEPVEAIVMAAGGYNLVQEYATWRRYGRRFSPQLVLLVLCPNDIEALPDVGLPPADDELRAATQRLAAGFHGTFWTRAYRRLHLYSLARNALWQSPTGKRVFDGIRGLFAHRTDAGLDQRIEYEIWTRLAAGLPLSTDQAAVWDHLLALIAALEKEVDQSGGRLAVVMIPFREHIDPQRFRLLLGSRDPVRVDLERPDRQLADALQARHIPFFSCGPVLRRQAAVSGDALYFRYDAHLSARGHEVVANALRQWVSTRRLL